MSLMNFGCFCVYFCKILRVKGKGERRRRGCVQVWIYVVMYLREAVDAALVSSREGVAPVSHTYISRVCE